MDVPKPLLVAVGGMAGAGLRWAVAEIVTSPVWSLVVVNSAGAFLLGALIGSARHRGRESLRLWLGAGFCGGLTTFSTLAVEVAARLDTGAVADGASFAMITVGTGLAAGAAGHLLGRRAGGVS